MKTFTFPDAPCRQLEIHLHAMVWVGMKQKGYLIMKPRGFAFFIRARARQYLRNRTH